ncbi:MAG: leucine-rich repeat domain-containing protein, partial [Ruminiclostridium sp.]|nr:leucine-rich repeat domain-containing protein [Ruminiclostridium sp.]
GRNIFRGNIIDDEHTANCPGICKMREENPLVIVNGNLLDAMECDGEIFVPDEVLSICPSAFSELDLNARPTSVRLPEGLKKIPDYLFMGLFDMVNVTIPESVTEIGEGAFDHCVSLSSLTLPDGVTSIGKDAFAYFTETCTVTYRGETYPCERYDELYALFGVE